MGSPTAEHEHRVELLAAMASLAGYTAPARLADGLLPDIARLDLRRRRLFVADAKASETPGTEHTRARLVAYARASRTWLGAGFPVRLAVAHSASRQADWLDTVTLAARIAGIAPVTSGTAPVGELAAVAWVDYSSPAPTTGTTHTTGPWFAAV